MAKYKKKLEEDIRCPLEYGLAIFGGKWKSRIICVLAVNEKLRYSQLRKEMYNITDAVLAATLKDLVEDGIAERKSYDEIPPRVEYSLTEKGKSVVPILQSICQWSDIFYKEEQSTNFLSFFTNYAVAFFFISTFANFPSAATSAFTSSAVGSGIFIFLLVSSLLFCLQ